MSPKQKALNRMVQKTNRSLDHGQDGTYRTVMALVLKNYPVEIADKVSGLLRSGDYLKLLEWADCYGRTEYSSPKDAFLVSQLTALIKKYPFRDPKLPAMAKKKALAKFLASEQRCKRYNLKFRRFATAKKRDTRSFRHSAMRDWIRYVIGEVPDMTSIHGLCSFGPGASIGVHGNATHMARKFLSQEWSCTPTALAYVIPAMETDPLVWELLCPHKGEFYCHDPLEFRKELLAKYRPIQHNKIVFVPKTALVDRTIAIEPLLNGYVQKGIDEYLRLLLKRVGLDLEHQEPNQELALLGSLPNQVDPFVTIDLSSASDSISLEVVRYLLPPAWFDLLNRTRSPGYTFDGANYLRYEKFTSMGNGFCFPLETLIFASVCAVLSKPKDFIVYGDDIIVRQSVAHEVLKTLWGLGFRHNTDKTFLSGEFRESCGADYYAGQNVRPLNLDYTFAKYEDVIKFHNLSLQETRWASYFSEVREYLRGLIPREHRLTRPYKGVVTGAFEVELDEFQSSPYALWDRDTQAWSWLELEARSVNDNDIASVKRYNTVLMMAALRGFSSKSKKDKRELENPVVQLSPFAYRRKTTQTVTRKGYGGSNSNWIPPQTA